MALATIVDRVATINRATAGSWDLFTGHRARLTSLISALCGTGVARLAILGAGNCNDIDLHRLLTRASRIELLDLDGEALEQGVIRQGLVRSRRVELHPGIDVTGAAAALPRCTSVIHRPLEGESHISALTDADIDRYRQQLGSTSRLPALAGCDVIVSACLLSQLISPLVDLLGAEDPRLLGLVQRVRDQHLDVLRTHLGTGGRALLASDFVSSDTCPALLNAPDHAVESLAIAALQDRNFFTGTNPLVVLKRLHALGGATIDGVRFLKPWRWRLSNARAFLVYALTFRVLPKPSHKSDRPRKHRMTHG